MFLSLVSLISLIGLMRAKDAASCSKFDCEYNVLRKLIQLEEKTSQQDSKITDLLKKLKEAENTITKLNDTITSDKKSADGSTYVRWGRTTCPDTSVLVYDGYVAGSQFTHSGTGSNP